MKVVLEVVEAKGIQVPFAESGREMGHKYLYAPEENPLAMVRKVVLEVMAVTAMMQALLGENGREVEYERPPASVENPLEMAKNAVPEPILVYEENALQVVVTAIAIHGI
jgi:hypothetical protein